MMDDRMNRENETTSSGLIALLGRIAQLGEWIASLDGRASEYPEGIVERVRGEYETDLSAAKEELVARADEARAFLEHSERRDRTLRLLIDDLRREGETARLRLDVGEYSKAEYGAEVSEIERQVGVVEGVAARMDQLTDTCRDLIGLAPEEPEPVQPEPIEPEPIEPEPIEPEPVQPEPEPIEVASATVEPEPEESEPPAAIDGTPVVLEDVIEEEPAVEDDAPAEPDPIEAVVDEPTNPDLVVGYTEVGPDEVADLSAEREEEPDEQDSPVELEDEIEPEPEPERIPDDDPGDYLEHSAQRDVEEEAEPEPMETPAQTKSEEAAVWDDVDASFFGGTDSAPTRIALVRVDGDRIDELVVLGDKALVIGSAAGADVRVADPSVSPKHCRIFPEFLDYVVADSGSKGGTFVNGTRLKEKRTVEIGDVIKLGTVRLELKGH